MEIRYDSILEREYQYSFEMKYKLLPWIVNDKVDVSVLRWIGEVYNDIVKPMTIGVKQIMSELSIVNEAELFCSDLEFKDS